ncbi:hypothetical protein [uncultured Akkermansia sp.]|uniref:hypothetical protein n=1 Tax=uncultured Akkermansia sp. TaxID=512294 RepID=UPI0026DB20C0|nr:hypothetical protein [uncultured Akkermansia sp.]
MMKQIEGEPHWEQLPERTISWSAAWKMIEDNNLDLKESKMNLRQAEWAVTSVFTQMIPGVNLDLMMTRDINGLSSLSARDVEYHTNILFNMPSLTQVPFDYYSAKASVYASKNMLEMKKRELLSQLYRQVLLYDNAIRSRKNALDSIPYDDDGTQRAKVDRDWEKTRKDMSKAFSLLLGDVDSRWFVNPVTLPRINWAAYRKASRKLDFLVVSIMAMELEASRLNVLDVKMRFFPSMDINFYSPSLFTGSGGTYSGFFAGARDMQVNMSLKEQLDTRLDVWNQYRNARDNHKILEKKIRLRLLDRREKVEALIKSRDEFESWQSYYRKKAEFLKKRLAFSGEEYLQLRKDIQSIYHDLDSEAVKNAEVEAALIMEYGWLR